MTDDSERPSAAHRILLVEREPEVRAALAGSLGRFYAVRAVATAEEGLAVLHDERFVAVALCDEEEPELGGPELLALLCERSPTTVGLLMAEPERLGRAARALGRGAVRGVVPKPCDLGELCAAIDEAIRLHEGREAELVAAGELEFLNQSLGELAYRLEERVLAQTASLRRLHRLAVELNGAATLTEVARLAAEAAFESLGGGGVHVQIWDPEEVCVEWNLGPEMSSSMHRQALQTRDGAVGELVVDGAGPTGAPLDAVELDLVASIASSTAIAVHNELRRRERDEAQYATIVALARLSEQRDNETGRHLERVSLYCKLVAEGLRDEGHYTELITDAFVRDLERSAPLHDIGKVGIPDSILLKPGKLSPEEWEIMKTHAEIGAATLSSVMLGKRTQGFLEMGRDIALHHHEKWDGSGYPRGLAGEAIPLAARIVALADVYDALTTVRPYKRAWPHQKALDWIRQGAGTHFDPLVVEVFAAREQAAEEIRARLADDPAELSDDGEELLARSA